MFRSLKQAALAILLGAMFVFNAKAAEDHEKPKSKESMYSNIAGLVCAGIVSYDTFQSARISAGLAGYMKNLASNPKLIADRAHNAKMANNYIAGALWSTGKTFFNIGLMKIFWNGLWQ